MDDQRKKAFDSAQDAVKQLLTLATSVLALTITFYKDVAGNAVDAKVLLGAAWTLYSVSILMGLIALLAMVGSLEPGTDSVNGTPSIRFSNVTRPAAVQIVAFFLATGTVVAATIISLFR